MNWIVGRKSDHSIVEITTRSAGSYFTLQQVESIFPSKFGGVKEDYSFYEITEEESYKYVDGQSYQIIWNVDEISSIDFSLEESKPWAKLFTDKTAIKDDGIDSAFLTLEVWKSDLSEIDTSITLLDRRIPVITPRGLRYVRLNIINGTATANFKSTESGLYNFPSEPKRFGIMRIYNQIVIEVDQTSLLEIV